MTAEVFTFFPFNCKLSGSQKSLKVNQTKYYNGEFTYVYHDTKFERNCCVNVQIHANMTSFVFFFFKQKLSKLGSFSWLFIKQDETT